MSMNKYRKALNTINDTLIYYMVNKDILPLPSDNEIYDSMAVLRNFVDTADSFKWTPFVVENNEIISECPEQYEKILVTDGEDIWVDLWDDCGDYFGLESNDDVEGLAWMQLPQPNNK